MLDSQSIDIPCSNCGHKTSKSVAWIRTHHEFNCGGCKTNIRLDARQFISEIKKVEKATDDFRQRLSRLGKR